MTAPTAVAQAERELDLAAAALAKGLNATMEDSERYVNARKTLIAAVRAECADRVRLDWLDANKPTASLLWDGETTDVQLQTKDDEYEGATFRAAIDAALEAKP